MGYLLIAISLVAGATKGYCGKMTSGYVNKYSDAMFANLIRMILCILIGFLMIAFSFDIPKLAITKKVFFITLLSGITTSGFVVFWLVSVKRGAYMMLDVFLMLGVMIPLIGSSIKYNETIRPVQWIGLVILFVSVIIMCSYNNSIKSKMSLSSLLLLIACGISNGLVDFSQKLFVKEASQTPISVFNFYTYLFSAIVLAVFYFIFKKQEKSNGEKADILHIFGYITIMSICLFAYSYFKTKAANYLPSAQIYPLSQGLGLIISSFMSALLFHEKLTAKCITGIAMSFVALIFINVL